MSSSSTRRRVSQILLPVALSAALGEKPQADLGEAVEAWVAVPAKCIPRFVPSVAERQECLSSRAATSPFTAQTVSRISAPAAAGKLIQRNQLKPVSFIDAGFF